MPQRLLYVVLLPVFLMNIQGLCVCLVAPIFAIMAIVNCFIKDQSKIFEYSIIWVGVYVVIGGIIMVFYNMWIISKM